MRNIITGLLLTLMSTVGWGETYVCTTSHNEQMVLERIDGGFEQSGFRPESDTKFFYKISAETDQLLVLERQTNVSDIEKYFRMAHFIYKEDALILRTGTSFLFDQFGVPKWSHWEDEGKCVVLGVSGTAG
jgi:hypothetical protein